MSSYGRNFGFRIVPEAAHRKGRFSVPTSGNRLPIGAPIVADVSAGATALTAYPTMNVELVKLATGAQQAIPGQSGLLVYEYGPAAFAGFDQELTTYADLDTVPLGANVQMVNGPNSKVVFKNTTASTFLHVRTYAGRNIVDPAVLGSTPGVVGNYLTPGVGNDTDGYWALTATEADGWLVITSVDTVRGEVEAHFMF